MDVLEVGCKRENSLGELEDGMDANVGGASRLRKGISMVA